jgi:hypothetical protein
VTRISAGWSCLLVSVLISLPVLSAQVVGDGGAPNSAAAGDPQNAATVQSFPLPSPFAFTFPSPLPSPAPLPVFSPPPPAATPAATPAPPPPPLAAAQPPAAPPGFCADFLSINVVDPELVGVVEAGAGLLSEHFGCQKFRIDGTGLPVKFGQVTPLFNARVVAYAHNTPESYEVWLNPECWGVVEDWSGIVAHELGHYLGWNHGNDHPYMWLAPPPGSYAQPGDLAIVCY